MERYSLEALNITKHFPGVIANKNVEIMIKQNEIHGLIGENGAGKSTLLKILNGWYPYGTFEGKILIDGNEVQFHTPHDANMKGIGFVPQEINVLENLTVAENIFVGNLTRSNKNLSLVSYKSINELAGKLLEENHIPLDPKALTRTLSVGQKQLLMVARALSRKPSVLILDEPTTSLTMTEVDNLFLILRQLQTKNTSIVFVTHKLAEIMEITDSVTILRDGCNISTYNKADYNKEKIVTDMVGRKIENMFPKRNSKTGDEILRVEDLTVEHPRILNRNLIQGISFSLRRGEVLGLAGLIGAGRTEVFNALFGVSGYSSGRIFIEGKEMPVCNEMDAIRKGFAYVTEDRKKNGLLFCTNIKKNITISNFNAASVKGFIKEILEDARAHRYFSQMKVKAPCMETGVLALSGGNQQKVVIGRALNTEPKIILLDEPTKGIDVGAKNDIYNLINELVEMGVSIIMVSSELPELVEMCDRIIVMANGEIAGEFGKDEINETKIMLAATRSKNIS